MSRQTTGAMSAILFALGGLVCGGPSVVGRPQTGGATDFLYCRPEERGATSPFFKGPYPEATLSSPTPQSIEGNKLFAQQKWEQAIEVLQPLLQNQTDISLGERQNVEFTLAICFLKIGKTIESVRLFVNIWTNPNHTKHKEAALYQMPFLTESSTVFTVIDSFEQYSPFVSRQCDVLPAAQRSTCYDRNYLAGRFYFRQGNLDESQKHFAAVSPSSRFADYAKQCIALIQCDTDDH